MQTPQGLNMQGLVLFGMPVCAGCDQAAAWLKSHGFAFTKYDVTTSRAVISWLQQATGQRTVPQFFLNGQYVSGGFNQVMQLAASGHIPRGRPS